MFLVWLTGPDWTTWTKGGEAAVAAEKRKAATMTEADYHTHRPLEACDWYLVWTNPRCEERAMAGMLAKGLAVYRPMVTKVRAKKANRPRVEVEVGMFTRYLFAGLDRARGQCFGDVRSCDGVEGLVSFDADGAPLAVPLGDLKRVVAYAASGAAARKDAPAVSFKLGEMVRIVAGPFEGFQAEVCAYSRRKREVTAEFGLMGRQVAVTVDVDSVRKRA